VQTTCNYYYIDAGPSSGGGGSTPGGTSSSGTGWDDIIWSSSGGGGTSTSTPTDTSTITTTPDVITSSNIPIFSKQFLQFITFSLSQEQKDFMNELSSFDAKLRFQSYFDKYGYSNTNKSFVGELINIIKQEEIIDGPALSFMLEAQAQGKIYNAFDIEFLNSVNQYMDQQLLSSFEIALNTNPIYIHFLTRMAVIRALNPNMCNDMSTLECDLKVFWEASKDVVHLTLDAIGIIPGIGEVADLANGAIYLVEGDTVNASFSFAASIPFVGWTATGSKYAVKIVTNVAGEKSVKILAKSADEVAALAFKLKEKFVLVSQNGIYYLKDLTGNVISQGDDVGRVVGNIADAINDRQRNVINQHRNTIGNATNKRKGNFGEMASDLDLGEKGYIPLHTRIDNIDASGHNGIDAVMEKNGQYFIVESKFSSTTTPSLNPANPSTDLPKKMSDAWINQRDYERLRDILNPNVANDIIDSGYTRVLATHGPNGNKIYKLVDANGNIGGTWTP